MGLPVTYYKNTDVGAPIVRPTSVADWFLILKACLVNGYGTKIGLGWTILFETANSIVFRSNPSVGSGCVVQFTSNSGYTDVIVAGGASGINTFTNKIYGRRFRHSTSASDSAGWFIAGTGRGFYFAQYGSASTVTALGTWCAYVGDVESLVPLDTAPYTMLTGFSASADDYGTTTANNIGAAGTLYAGFLGAQGGSTVVMNSFSGNSFKSTTGVGNIRAPNTPVLMFRPILNGLVSNGDSGEYPSVRGFIPGLHISTLCETKGLLEVTEVTIGGDIYRGLRGDNGTFLWVKVSGEWYV